MEELNPIVTSTPDEHKTDSDNRLKRRGRKNIHHCDEVIEHRRSFGETSPILSNEPEFDSDEDLEERSIGLLKDNELTYETIIPQTSFISKKYIIITGLIAFIISASWIIFNYPVYQSIGAIRNLSDEEFSQNIHHLQSKYNSVNTNVFTELESAVKFTGKNGFPQSFVFAHHSDEKSTMTLTLIKDLARLSSQYLGNGRILTISLDNLDTEDYGELLTLWRPDIELGHTVFVPNLQQVPAHLAPVFHTLCDEVTPYVRGTLYLHTVNLGSNIPSTQQRNNKTGPGYFTTVQKRLRQSWPNMTDEIFDPLLTRIAGSIHILD